jgi:hypothetical protein
VLYHIRCIREVKSHVHQQLFRSDYLEAAICARDLLVAAASMHLCCKTPSSSRVCRKNRTCAKVDFNMKFRTKTDSKEYSRVSPGVLGGNCTVARGDVGKRFVSYHTDCAGKKALAKLPYGGALVASAHHDTNEK